MSEQTVNIQSVIKNYSDRLQAVTHQLILLQARTEMLDQELAEARAKIPATFDPPQNEDDEVTP